MSPFDYHSTLEYMNQYLPMYQRVGKTAYKKDIHNIRALCDRLGNPERKFRSIHIGGTNGKGSVSSMTHSVLVAAGYKVGLYTSPHLIDVRERIRINSEEISHAEVVDFIERIKPLIDEIRPSFFEATVAMAFDHFAQNEVDIAVVEVGLGGRLDSTNVITGDISVITNISWDHMEILGNTFAAIASEKAGIIKEGKPVVIGESHAETRPVFIAKALEKHSSITFADRTYVTRLIHRDLFSQEIEVRSIPNPYLPPRRYKLDLPGVYQEKNIKTLLRAVDTLRETGWDIPEEALQEGLSRVRSISGLKGRMQVLQEKPLVIADTGHNEAGIKAVVSQLSEFPHKQLHIVWGMVREKDVNKIFSLLPKDAHYYFVKPDLPRGLETEALIDAAAIYELKGRAYESVEQGLLAAFYNAGVDDLVYVGGSTFVVAEALTTVLPVTV